MLFPASCDIKRANRTDMCAERTMPQRWLATQPAHEPGDELFVDYAGQTVPITDRYTREQREAQIFVVVLGCSNPITHV